MNISEIRALKAGFETHLLLLLKTEMRGFEEATGANISGLSVHLAPLFTIGDTCKKYLPVAVEVEVKI